MLLAFVMTDEQKSFKTKVRQKYKFWNVNKSRTVMAPSLGLLTPEIVTCGPSVL